MIEQTTEQKAETMAEKVARALFNDPDGCSSETPIERHANIILRELNLAELVKCKDQCEQLTVSQMAAEAETMQLRAKVQELERQWQPIATAPKDGTEILGWRWDSGVLIIRWTSPSEFLTDTELERMSEESSFKSDWFYSDLIAGGRLEGDEAPTHWMPLPSTATLDNAREGKPTSAPEHSPESRTTDP